MELNRRGKGNGHVCVQRGDTAAAALNETPFHDGQTQSNYKRLLKKKKTLLMVQIIRFGIIVSSHDSLLDLMEEKPWSFARTPPDKVAVAILHQQFPAGILLRFVP